MWKLVLPVLAVCVMRQFAQGVIVTNVTRDVVVFDSSGFEHDTPGHEPFASLQKSYVPQAWSSAGQRWDVVVSRKDRYVHPKPPEGGEGLHYLRTTRDAAGSGHPVARFSTPQTRAGDLIRAEFSLNLPPDADVKVTLGHDSGDRVRGLLRFSKGAVRYYDGAAWQPVRPTVTYVPEQWQAWTIEYVVGEETFSVKVGDGRAGTADALMSLNVRGGGDLSHIGFGHNREQTYAIDASAAARAGAAARPSEVRASQDLPQLLQITWRTGPDLPQGIQTPGAGVIDDQLIWTGGFCSGGTLYPGNVVPGKPDRYTRGFFAKTWSLDLNDPSTGWQSLPDLPNEGRQSVIAAVVDDAFYVWGGFNYTEPFTYTEGYRLSRRGGDWHWDKMPDLPWALCFSGAATRDGKLYVLGGSNYDKTGKAPWRTQSPRTGDVDRMGARLIVFDTADTAAGWKELPACPGTPRFMPALASVGEYLYLMGGITGHDNPRGRTHIVVDNWRYHVPTATWERLDDLPVASSRFPTNAIVYDGRYILLVGGVPTTPIMNPDGSSRPLYGRPYRSVWGRTMFSDVYVYDTVTQSFGRANPMPVCNNMPIAVLHGKSLYLLGGETEGVELNGVHYGHHTDLLLVGDITPVERD